MTASPNTPADVPIETQARLAEYSALRAEVGRRANVQWNVVALQITSAGAIASLAISTPSNFALLLLIPLSSYMLGSRYILHDFHIKLINGYIADTLSVHLAGALGWERWIAGSFAEKPDRRWWRPTGWTMLHPTRLAFEGIAALALVGAVVIAAYGRRAEPPDGLLIVGFCIAWSLGILATSLLHNSFVRSSGASALQPPQP